MMEQEPVPFTRPSPTQHPHLKSPSWYFPNACRIMVMIAMRGFTMQNCSVACTGGETLCTLGSRDVPPPSLQLLPPLAPPREPTPLLLGQRHRGESSSPLQE